MHSLAMLGIPKWCTPSHQVFPPPGAFGNPSIQLASLIHLTLDDILIPFLATIDAPRLEKLEIDCELSDASSARLLLEGLHHQLPTLARLTTDAQNFKFGLSSYASYQIVIGGLDLALFMWDLRPNVLEKTLDWICNHLGRSVNDLPAHLEVADWEPAIPSRLKWLTRHLTVTKLKLHSDPRYGTALDPIIPFLSRPTTSTPVTRPSFYLKSK
ncbi:hypothetical protein M407DRAFT_24087 [Tulasnella calospora MUT 4182]|uniref:Uncharacterized protein n=1 Tax=Tulasnella calospora MUT 4182 TaxID=1051891 RepID=A0A0C3KZ32_9AGAM|nr:hypothetical protein M407DRAFT_24087 [Tulasnella calospora MUT 4182]